MAGFDVDVGIQNKGCIQIVKCIGDRVRRWLCRFVACVRWVFLNRGSWILLESSLLRCSWRESEEEVSLLRMTVLLVVLSCLVIVGRLRLATVWYTYA